MSTIASIKSKLIGQDPSFKVLSLPEGIDKRHCDENIIEITKHLINIPNVLESLQMTRHRLTDEAGINIAQYVAISTTIEHVILYSNAFTTKTYTHMAAALYTNSSLQGLWLSWGKYVVKHHVDILFINALRINPVRSRTSRWYLYAIDDVFDRLKTAAEKSAPPSMLEFMLCVHS